MSIYERFRNVTAPRLLARFDQGGLETTIQTVVPNPDPTQPPAIITSQRPVRAVVRGVKAELVASIPDLQLTDLQAITDADSGFVPVVGHHVLINGQTRAILRVEAVPAAGNPVIYKFLVR